jgi:hypothetical protein
MMQIRRPWRAAALAIIGATLLLGCAAKKKYASQHFGSGENFPVFEGPGDFLKSYNRVLGIMLFKKLDGQPVDLSWIDPAFRERLCLVVTINNHCGGG